MDEKDQILLRLLSQGRGSLDYAKNIEQTSVTLMNLIPVLIEVTMFQNGVVVQFVDLCL